jgi:DNA-binding NtrC family response regulator
LGGCPADFSGEIAMGTSQVIWIGASLAPPPGWPWNSAGWAIDFQDYGAGLDALSRTKYAVVVLDRAACDLLDQVQRIAPGVPVMVHDPEASVGDAVRLVRQGVRQFLTSPEAAVEAIDDAVEESRARALTGRAASDWERLLVGESREMRAIHEVIRTVASRRATVLVTGETGTGKELAARALHLAGDRRNGPWVAVNCSALPETLLESELFGHVRGAFTGAIQSRAGRFEQAHGGTLFLDEIGEMPLELQSKLLRVLQEREVQRLGGSETTRVDIRVVAATNRDLGARVRQGYFREDLYYRLNVVPLEMPSLRSRPGDIALLAGHFVEKICRVERIQAKSLTREATDRLRLHPWPGNVRQLENAVEMAVAMSGDRVTLAAADFPLPKMEARVTDTPRTPLVAVPDCGLDYEETLAVIERSILEQALRKTGGNKKAAAEMLRLKRTTLSAKVRSLEAVA